jgi:cell division protein ZapA
MSNVTLTIGGRFYSVACGAGEEAHIEALGRTIDGKLSGMPSLSGQSEARTLLFAALLLADELHELRSGGDTAPAPADDGAADALEALAGRLERLAAELEG